MPTNRDPAERPGDLHLWRRRLLEMQLGLDRALARREGVDDLVERWIDAKHEAFAGEDQGDPAKAKQRFFDAQAAAEALVCELGEGDELGAWARDVGAAFAELEAGHGRTGVTAAAGRLAAQADAYGSEVERRSDDPDRESVDIGTCAIWTYRKRREQAGVELTLEAPCHYCVPAVEGMAAAAGCTARVELRDQPVHGCSWRFEAAPAQDIAGAAPDGAEPSDLAVASRSLDGSAPRSAPRRAVGAGVA